MVIKWTWYTNFCWIIIPSLSFYLFLSSFQQIHAHFHSFHSPSMHYERVGWTNVWGLSRPSRTWHELSGLNWLNRLGKVGGQMSRTGRVDLVGQIRQVVWVVQVGVDRADCNEFYEIYCLDRFEWAEFITCCWLNLFVESNRTAS